MEYTWLNSLEKDYPHLPKIIIANKADLPKVVSEKEITTFEEKHKLKVYKTSAKDNSGINEPFDIMIDIIVKNKNKIKGEKEKGADRVSLYDVNKKNQKEEGCCK